MQEGVISIMKIIFLGTGASGGTPGIGKSKRLESAILLSNETKILVDVTRNFFQQASIIKHIDYILLTHGHKDAIGGFNQLRRWWTKKKQKPIKVFAHPKTRSAIHKHFKLRDHCEFINFQSGQNAKIDDWHIEALEVPHSRSKQFPTFAWKIRNSEKSIIYVSDIAFITTVFTKFCQKADLLIIDGAMWKDQIFTHLTIDKYISEVCRWKVKKIFLTQLGKSIPSHEQLAKEIHFLCSKTSPAYDGLILNIS